MKVIKRDGRIVDYDRNKIKIAVEKANNEVSLKQKATKEDIKKIITYIEDLNKKRILVEDIQDIIEEKLMEFGKYELAKKYIVYRYTRALVRKSNTTDESILGLIRHSNRENMDEEINNNSMIASTQRNLIAGEVSKDLTKRILLPEKITKAWEDGILHFHNSDYFIQPIFNCCTVNISDMLDNGTVMNGMKIESPKTFQVACTVVTQIISAVASNQYGGQTIDITHLGKYLRKSKDKFEKEIIEEAGKCLDKDLLEKLLNKRIEAELSTGIQIMQYQLNTLMATNGKVPLVTVFLHLNQNDDFIKENAMIIEEVLKQRIEGMKNEKGENVIPRFPRLVYVLDECNCLKGEKYDYLTKLAEECSLKTGHLYFLSAKVMKENYEDNIFCPMGERSFLLPWKDKDGQYIFEGRFNQGVVTINLPQIAIVADGNEEIFWNLLDERLELCREALMCRHYALLGTFANISPIHWRYGAIARLDTGEKIDELLYGGYSTLSLGYIGIYEMTKLMKGVAHTVTEGHNFAIKVMQYMKKIVLKWRKESNIGFCLYAAPDEGVKYRFARMDKENYGTIEDITDKEYYTNSYYVDYRDQIDILKKLKFESEFQDLSDGGAITSIDISDENLKDIDEIIRYIYDNIQYVSMKKI